MVPDEVREFALPMMTNASSDGSRLLFYAYIQVTEVAATITIAYLCYYTADSAWGTSGVIAVVTLGVIAQAFGRGSINDGKLYEDFWSMIEWFLNTVLFSLGGLVWGSIVANNDPDYPELVFTGRDWGYIFVNYILLTVIRFGLFTVAYPITANIGLRSSPQECFFQAYGGLRGAVGIALAIFLENLVRNKTLEGAVIDSEDAIWGKKASCQDEQLAFESHTRLSVSFSFSLTCLLFSFSACRWDCIPYSYD
jgi:NhaP-type Na+/H+ or K+/H+ antiporter